MSSLVAPHCLWWSQDSAGAAQGNQAERDKEMSIQTCRNDILALRL